MFSLKPVLSFCVSTVFSVSWLFRFCYQYQYKWLRDSSTKRVEGAPWWRHLLTKDGMRMRIPCNCKKRKRMRKWIVISINNVVIVGGVIIRRLTVAAELRCALLLPDPINAGDRLPVNSLSSIIRKCRRTSYVHGPQPVREVCRSRKISVRRYVNRSTTRVHTVSRRPFCTVWNCTVHVQNLASIC